MTQQGYAHRRQLSPDEIDEALNRTSGWTTGEVGRLLGIAPRTVVKWWEKGYLSGWRLPDSGDRRVSTESLRKLVTQQGRTDILDLLQATNHIRATGFPVTWPLDLTQSLPVGWTVTVTEFWEIAKPSRAILLLGPEVPRQLALDLARFIRGSGSRQVLLAVMPEDTVGDDRTGYLEAGYRVAWAWPLEVMMVAKEVLS